jgi:hypothetical protein
MNIVQVHMSMKMRLGPHSRSPLGASCGGLDKGNQQRLASSDTKEAHVRVSCCMGASMSGRVCCAHPID